MPKTVHSIAALLLSLAPVAAAWAGNDEGIPLGDDAALTGCTVAAMISDGSSLFYNPAGLAGAERDQVDVGATATMLRRYSVPNLVSTVDSASGDGSFTELVSVPAAVSYVRALSPSLKLGLGLFAPESRSSTIDVSLPSGADTFHLSTSSRETVYFGMAGLGWRATPELRLGASISAIYVSSLAEAVAWAGYGQGAATRQLYGITQLFSVTALGANASVGLQWEPTPGLHVGFALRSPSVLLATALAGSSVEGSATTEPSTANLQTTDLGDLVIGVHTARPFRARLGVAWAWGTSWVGVEGDIQPGLTEETIGVSRQTTFNVRAGGVVEVAAQTWLGFGAFTDRSADSIVTSLIASRIDYYGVTVGLRFDHPHDLSASERARTVVFSTTIGLRYAYGTGDIGGVIFDRMPAASPPGRNSTVSATVHELGVHLGSTVYF
jgi:hypothetical protein